MILYMLGAESENQLKEYEDVYIREYDHADMLQVFKEDILKYLESVSHVVVDEKAVIQDTWEAAAELLQTMRHVPILLIIRDEAVTETYIHRETYDVLNGAHKDIQDMVRDWLMDQVSALTHTWIAIAGLTAGCGVTSTALHLAAYIRQQEQDVSVTERADVFSVLADTYQWDELAKNSYQWNGILYNHNLIDEEAAYTIFDLGVWKDNLKIWEQCQIKIFVVDAKPYRMMQLQETIERLREMPGKIILAFTFVPESERQAIEESYTSDKVRVWFVPLEPDLFRTSEDYQELVQGYVEPVSKETESRKIIKWSTLKLRLEQKTKSKLLIGGCVLVSILAGMGISGLLQRQRELQMTEIAVQSIQRMDLASGTKIRLMMLQEADTETEVILAADGKENDTTTETGIADEFAEASALDQTEETDPEARERRDIGATEETKYSGTTESRTRSSTEAVTSHDTRQTPDITEVSAQLLTEATTAKSVLPVTEAPRNIAEETTEKTVQPTTEASTVKAVQPTTEASTAKAIQPTTEVADAEIATSTTETVLVPSLRGYQGQIYTGAQVAAIMNKFAGQPVAMHLITRSQEGWYNYTVSSGVFSSAASVNAGIAEIDEQCSFLSQVIRENGEDVGLEFIQQ